MTGFVRQSAPALAIFGPGQRLRDAVGAGAGLSARGFQPLSAATGCAGRRTGTTTSRAPARIRAMPCGFRRAARAARALASARAFSWAAPAALRAAAARAAWRAAALRCASAAESRCRVRAAASRCAVPPRIAVALAPAVGGSRGGLFRRPGFLGEDHDAGHEGENRDEGQDAHSTRIAALRGLRGKGCLSTALPRDVRHGGGTPAPGPGGAQVCSATTSRGTDTRAGRPARAGAAAQALEGLAVAARGRRARPRRRVPPPAVRGIWTR